MKQGAAKGEVKRRRRTGYYDYNLLAAVIILICFGLVCSTAPVPTRHPINLEMICIISGVRP